MRFSHIHVNNPTDIAVILFAETPGIVLIFVDIVWLSLGVVWLLKFYIPTTGTSLKEAKEVMLGKLIKASNCGLSLMIFVVVCFSCLFYSFSPIL